MPICKNCSGAYVSFSGDNCKNCNKLKLPPKCSNHDCSNISKSQGIRCDKCRSSKRLDTQSSSTVSGSKKSSSTTYSKSSPSVYPKSSISSSSSSSSSSHTPSYISSYIPSYIPSYTQTFRCPTHGCFQKTEIKDTRCDSCVDNMKINCSNGCYRIADGDYNICVMCKRKTCSFKDCKEKALSYCEGIKCRLHAYGMECEHDHCDTWFIHDRDNSASNNKYCGPCWKNFDYGFKSMQEYWDRGGTS